MIGRVLMGFMAVASGVGGAALVMAPEQVSDALHLPPDDRVVLAMRVGGALVVVGALIGVVRAIR